MALFIEKKEQEQEQSYYNQLLAFLINDCNIPLSAPYWEKAQVDEGCIFKEIYNGTMLSLPENALPFHKLYFDYVHEIWKSGHFYQDINDTNLMQLIFPVDRLQVVSAMKRALMQNLHYNYLTLCIEFKGCGKRVTKQMLKGFFAMIPRTAVGKGKIKTVLETVLDASMFIQDIMDENAYYPSVEWIEGLKWNKTDTYEGMFKAMGVTEPFAKTLFLTASKACANRWAVPGSDNHITLVLQSEQGAHKSRFIRGIAPLDSFIEANGFESKDDLMKLHRHSW